ncbi:MAG TPA: hypothetical protein VGM88_01980 [Kofleriaceae bacterium]|jgi:hypothetical protein
MRPVLAASVLALLAGIARAEPPVHELERALPSGWSLIATDDELVIRHDKPCYTAAKDAPAPQPPPGTSVPPPATPPRPRPPGQLVALELRYKLQPRWTDKQLADARATNAKLDAAARAEADRGHARAASVLTARRVALPLCTIGETSVFAGADTFALVGVALDPPEAAREVYEAIAAVRAHCTPIP